LAAARVRDYRLIWVGCGSEDIFFGGAKAFAERLKVAKIPLSSAIIPSWRSSGICPLIFVMQAAKNRQ
jgi:hypothetical protein